METNDLLKSSIQSINYIQAMEALYDIGLLRVLFLKIVLLRRIEESSFGKKEIEKAYKEYCAGCDELVTLKDSIPCDPDLF